MAVANLIMSPSSALLPFLGLLPTSGGLSCPRAFLHTWDPPGRAGPVIGSRGSRRVLCRVLGLRAASGWKSLFGLSMGRGCPHRGRQGSGTLREPLYKYFFCFSIQWVVTRRKRTTYEVPCRFLHATRCSWKPSPAHSCQRSGKPNFLSRIPARTKSVDRCEPSAQVENAWHSSGQNPEAGLVLALERKIGS